MAIHRLTTSIAAAAAFSLFLPLAAQAQPGPPPPPRGRGAGPAIPLWHPPGLVWGVDFGLGAMSSDEGDLGCIDCDFNPVAVGFGGSIGWQFGPRFQLRGDLRGAAQTLDADGTAFLVQTSLMIVARYFVSPRLWIEGGVGPTQLTLSIDDGYVAADDEVDQGGGGMGAIGYEVAKGRRAAISLEGRLFGAHYTGIEETITTALIGIRIDFHPRPIIVVGAGHRGRY